MLVNGPDTRPEVRIAEILEDGTVDTTDQYAFAQYENVPAVGDLIIKPPAWGDEPEAVVVVQRAYLHPQGQLGRWWVVTRAVADDAWRPLWELDHDVDLAFAEVSAEKSAEAMDGLRTKPKAERKT